MEKVKESKLKPKRTLQNGYVILTLHKWAANPISSVWVKDNQHIEIGCLESIYNIIYSRPF